MLVAGIDSYPTEMNQDTFFVYNFLFFLFCLVTFPTPPSQTPSEWGYNESGSLNDWEEELRERKKSTRFL